MLTTLFQQNLRAENIRTHKNLWPGNGTVDMGLGGKMDYRINSMIGKKPGHQGGVANIPFDESILGISFKSGQVFQIACIGQTIKISDKTPGVVCDKRVNKI
jgi:hypothetical protein